MTSIEAFFRLIGRGTGSSSPVAGSTTANSSLSSRQPVSASAAHNVLLPEPEGAGSSRARAPFARTAQCSTR